MNAASQDSSTSGHSTSGEGGEGGPGSSTGEGGGDAPTGTDATSDSGGAGGTSGDAADAGVVHPCSAPGLLFCDDFESRPLGAAFVAPWSTVGVAGSSAITVDDSVPAHSGTHAVLTHPASDAF